MKALWYLSDTHACGIVRADVPARAIGRKYPHVALVCKRGHMLSDIFQADVVILQRGCTFEDAHIARVFKSRRVPIIYDLDDDLFNVPPNVSDAHKYFNDPSVRKNVEQIIGMADVLCVSNELLIDVVRQHNKQARIFIIGNAIDIGHAKMTPRGRGPTVNIGWYGSLVHSEDAKLVSDGLKNALDKFQHVNVLIRGSLEPQHFDGKLDGYGERVHFAGWSAPNDLYAMISQFDIALCPIVDTQFNRCKSAIKWMEASAIGVPAIVSDAKPYEAMRHGIDCIKASTPDEWTHAIEDLVINREKADLIGRTAQHRVETEFDIDTVCDQWMQMLNYAVTL